MSYGLLAEVVVVLHAAFILFVMFGGLLAFWKRRMMWLHLPCLIWGFIIMAVGGLCPLTPLENHLRQLAGGQGYSDGFIEHYLLWFIYPDGLTRRAQLLLAGLLIGGNLIVYFVLFKRRWARLR